MPLFHIPTHLPFLDCLAAGVLRLIPGESPERLSRVTILLPTRRSARALRTSFLRAAEGQTLLLPRMRALAGLSTEDADELALPTLLDLPPAVDPLQRQAVLTNFILRLPRDTGGPATPEQAWSLAAALATLLDEIALEEKDLELLAGTAPDALAEHWLQRLTALVPETHAAHWQITLTFLRGIMAAWQVWLDEAGLLDIGMRRVQALRAQTRDWQERPPADPVIAAGIGVGGTIPAAEELLRVIAHDLPQGMVVLHGVDASSAEAKVWEAVPAAATHPFCGQRRLLAALGVEKDAIKRWDGCPPEEAVDQAAPIRRPDLLGMALRPAAGLPAWQSRVPSDWVPAMRGLSLLVAPDAQTEAAAIALMLREALEQEGARAALVTPDRDLARRVSSELARHGITADDSAGEPLGETPTGSFLRLLAELAASELAPVPLLAVLKHPICAGGWDRGDWVRAARRLERAALRGPRPAPGLDGLRAAAKAGLRREDRAEVLAEVMALLDRLGAGAGSLHQPARAYRPAADRTCWPSISPRPRRWRRPTSWPAACGSMPGRRARRWPSHLAAPRAGDGAAAAAGARRPGRRCSRRRWRARRRRACAAAAAGTAGRIRASRSSACWRRGC